MQFQLRIAAIATGLILLLVTAARAGQRYSVSGDDAYRIGTALAPTHITYSGFERLDILKDRAGRHYAADISYTRADESGTAAVHARFTQVLHPDGTFEDLADEDPDFLAILNQPFAVQLDATTLGDLERLRGLVPFEADSPFGGSRLRGYMRSAPAGSVAGHSVVGVRFEANGPMAGTLPQHPDALLSGTMHMVGTAYYALDDDALLLALDATLTIEGRLQSGHDSVPVRIIYHRAIRAGR
jgi:hypothetical protein